MVTMTVSESMRPKPDTMERSILTRPTGSSRR